MHGMHGIHGIHGTNRIYGIHGICGICGIRGTQGIHGIHGIYVGGARCIGTPPLCLGFWVTAPRCGEGFCLTRTWVQLDLKLSLLDRMAVHLLPHTEQHCAPCWGARWNGPSPHFGWNDPLRVVLWLLLAACCCAPACGAVDADSYRLLQMSIGYY